MHCAFCSGKSGIQHIFREMMFGRRDEFPYWECSGCGCLQIAEIPENLGEYYPADYYTFGQRLKRLDIWFYRAYFKIPGLAQHVHRAGAGFQAIINAKLKPGARILDVGCGGGKLVNILRGLGFDAQGIDLHLREETEYLRRASLQETVGQWDLIIFQHSLEHMADHIGVLRLARERLATNGTCLVRIPVANWAWQNYRKNWVQLDAPRHLIIHTKQSFLLASESAGFAVSHATFDSGFLQFYGSELYQRDIPLKDKNSAPLHKAAKRQFERRAAELNLQQLGDQASFYLKPL